MKLVKWSVTICVLMTAVAGTVNTARANGFPFRINENRFEMKNDSNEYKPVFLNIIGYEPLEPGQSINDEIREKRMKDDLRRWRAYQGGENPVAIRVYPQPTASQTISLPKAFYDGVRELGFWVIRDIYVSDYYRDPNALKDANDQIIRVIAEVRDANAFDLIFAWEIGNEFKVQNSDVIGLENFICHMSNYIKEQVNNMGGTGDSNMVTWGASTNHDQLWTWDYLPVCPNCVDYMSQNVYSYEPERMRDHQAGPVTGTPYQGYLAALKARFPNKPLVISETGFTDSNLAEPNSEHPRLHPWYPAYRKGGMTSEQAAEGLADRYWDARLLRDVSDSNIIIAGLAIFDWSDGWHKGESSPGEDNGLPEEHFGLGRFESPNGYDGYQLRYKLQQETIHDLYTLKFRNDPATLGDGSAKTYTLQEGTRVKLDTAMFEVMSGAMRYRWEANRGHIVANGASAEFYPDENVLGPARITTVSIDGDNYATVSSSKINLNPTESSSIEILTFGTRKASGRVHNVNLDKYKLIVYIKTNKLYAQPYQDQSGPHRVGMKSIWVDKGGYWWTRVFNDYDGELYCWLVPKGFEPNDLEDLYWTPNSAIAFAKMADMNDTDNDLLPDSWEPNSNQDRYDDPDKDGANNLEEFLAGTSPNDSNDPNKNDVDMDGLRDNWERNYFGDIGLYGANDDPDGDGLTNMQEHEPNLGNGPDPNFCTHPGRASQDSDRDGLPDVWENRWFGNLSMKDSNNPDGDCLNNLDEYELGTQPTIHMGDWNCDWIVDMNDLDAFTTAWLSNDPNYDIFQPKDNLVNFLDYALLAENWLLEL